MRVPIKGSANGGRVVKTEAVIERQPSRRQSKKIDLVPKLKQTSKFDQILSNFGIQLKDKKSTKHLCGYTQVCQFVGDTWQVQNPDGGNNGGKNFSSGGGDDQGGGNNNNTNIQDIVIVMAVAMIMGRISWCYRAFRNNNLLQYSSIVFMASKAKNAPREHLAGLEWMLVSNEDSGPPILRQL